MTGNGVEFYLVPSSDAHQNEYVPACWQRRAFISGFTGSAGEVLIGREKAWLWTDSRYHLQAEHQLDGTLFELMRAGAPEVPSLDDWLAKHADGGRLGVDPRLLSWARARELRKRLEGADGRLVTLADNLVDAVWETAPPLPCEPAQVLSAEHAGATAADKLARIRERLAERSCDWLLLTTLDAIAWTLNLRGRDVAFNPLLISYAIVGRERASLFVDTRKIADLAREHLRGAQVDVAPYEDFAAAVGELSGRVWLDPKTASLWVAEQIDTERVKIVEDANPVDLFKARKNATEQAGMRASHVRDGAALVRFLHWLEGAWGEGLDEHGAAERLEGFRREGEHFQGLSFPTISVFAGNGAIVHYGVSRETAARIDDSAPYLVDSGAQYLDGTTDVTRTIHLGVPTDEQRRHYTLVLKGHVALRHARFPKGTSGAQLDVLARHALWQEGLDYGHGTGHGVGHYLNVHEGPQSISPRGARVPLEPGMIVSNEPGFYLAERYGIRIENLVLVVEVASAEQTGGAPFYGFEDLTFVPYCRKLIDLSLLDAVEIAAIDSYHQQVFERLAEGLQQPARDWLGRETAPLS